MPATNTRSDSNPSRSNQSRRCQHLRADGKRCADAVYPGHASLYHYHLGHQLNSMPRGIANGGIIAALILHAIGNFQSAAAINVAIGKILIYQPTGRISRHDALALSYQCQLLLQTLPLIQKEFKEISPNTVAKKPAASSANRPTWISSLSLPSCRNRKSRFIRKLGSTRN